METSKSKGYVLEQQVADVYRLLNADIVNTNTRIAGHEVDVYVELKAPDGITTRLGIECKNYEARVGVSIATEVINKLNFLRASGEVDLPILITKNDITAEARTSLRAARINHLLYPELLRRISDFSNYLANEIDGYESSSIYKNGVYRRLTCINENGVNNGFIDDFVPLWFQNKGSFLVVLGDYGTGKTTFTRNYFYKLAKQYLESPSKNRIPIHIELKRYRKEINIRSLITDLLLHEYGVRIKDYHTFKKLNEKGRLTLIFDAFDEMAVTSTEAEISSNLKEIASLAGPKTNIILTCRTHYFKDQNELYRAHEGTSLYKIIDKHDSHSIVYVNPFTEEDVKAVVKAHSGKGWEKNFYAINSTYNLNELSRHPILCEMIVESIPKAIKKGDTFTPADLYLTYTGYWLNRDDWRSKMSHEQREYFSKEIGFYMQQSSCLELHYSSIPRHVKKFFPGISSYRELDYFESDIRTCTFLIRDQKGNYYFKHRSFQEYFSAQCAVHYITNGDWPDHLWKGIGQEPTDWITNETASFAIDLLQREKSVEWSHSLVFDSKNGALVLCILSLFHKAGNVEQYSIFDVALARTQLGSMESLDHRGKIEELALELHSENWQESYNKFRHKVINEGNENIKFTLAPKLESIKSELQKRNKRITNKYSRRKKPRG